MKKVIALITLAMMSIGISNIYAQESKAELKAQEKAERARLKAEEQVTNALLYNKAAAALQAKQFVMEADQIISRRGRSAFVNSNTNFILVNQKQGSIQVAFNTILPGPNGIGGITVDGNISDIKTTTNKKGNISCNFSVQGIAVSAQVFLTLTNGSNNASVTISPNFNSNSITLNGKLVPLEESNIYKGRSW